MRDLVFKEPALHQFEEWAHINVSIHKKILDLIANIIKTPYSGIGKPEA